MNYQKVPKNRSASGGQSTSPDHIQHSRLACQACQRKKIKCDRHYPCGQCQHSSLHCVPSQRKPRARHAGKRAVDTELRSRITKLESLVESLSGEVGVQNGSQPNVLSVQRRRDTDESPAALGKYVAPWFWSSLSTEVAALRDALHDESGDDDSEANGETIGTASDTSNQTAPGEIDPIDYDLIVGQAGRVFVVPGAFMEPSPDVAQYLLDAYLANVDPMYKGLHAPTLRTFMEQRTSYLGKDYESPSNAALRRAVWFAAVNSLQDDVCRVRFGRSKTDLLNYFRRLVSVSIAQADAINMPDIAALQAFTNYLASSRVTDMGHRCWTLAALVVRVARGMGLDREDPTQTPFMCEIRRRLWHQIRVLDAFTGVDRGTEPLVQCGSFDTLLPTHCNDADFGPGSKSVEPREGEITDMTFAIVVQTGSTTFMLLNTPENARSGDTCEKRQQLALDHEKQIRNSYLRHCDPAIPFQRFLLAVGDCMCASAILRAVRPMQRHVSSVPPRVDSPYVLQIATDNLRFSEYIWDDPDTAQWRWMIWMQWHALAVALAGLCSIRGTELAATTWHWVDKVYARSEEYVANGKNAMLWRPVEKLYRKAAAFRGAPPLSTPLLSTPQEPRVYGQNYAVKPISGAQMPAYALPSSSYTHAVGAPLVRSNTSDDGTLSSLYHSRQSLDALSLGQTEPSWHDWEHIGNDLPLSKSGLGDLGDFGEMQWMEAGLGVQPY